MKPVPLVLADGYVWCPSCGRRMKPVILITGMPRSGNRLIMRMLDDHALDVRIHHHLSNSHTGWEQTLEPTHMIIPTRKAHWDSWVTKSHRRARFDSPRKFWRAENKHRVTGMDTKEGQVRCHLALLDAFKDTPTLRVAYENLVSDPLRVGREIAEFVGLEKWKGWPEEIVDGDEKYRVG